jgi:hypothetical protein
MHVGIVLYYLGNNDENKVYTYSVWMQFFKHIFDPCFMELMGTDRAEVLVLLALRGAERSGKEKGNFGGNPCGPAPCPTPVWHTRSVKGK